MTMAQLLPLEVYPFTVSVIAKPLIFSLPGLSPGRAIVLPPASALVLAAAWALAKGLTFKFFM